MIAKRAKRTAKKIKGSTSKLHTISIRLDAEGNFVYEPAALRALQGDRIRWVSEDGAFALNFVRDTPVDAISVHGNRGEPTASLTVTTQSGVFHYTVAVAAIPPGTNDDMRVFMDSGCPDIIVGRDFP